MAAPAPPDYVKQPLIAIKGLFDAAVAAGGASGPDPESDWGVPALFRKHLSSEEAISKVRWFVEIPRAHAIAEKNPVPVSH